jgi:iron(III) transport system substrate-binding protein
MPALPRWAVAALLLWPALARGEPKLPDYYPPTYGATVESSQREGKLVVYTTMASRTWQPLLASFKKLYPWLTVQTLELDAGAMMARYGAEKAAKGTTADLMVNDAAEAWQGLAAKGDILPYLSPEAATLPAAAEPRPGLYIMSVDPIVMVAIPKAVTSVNAAKLLLDHILSPDGQVALGEGGLTPYRRGRL